MAVLASPLLVSSASAASLSGTASPAPASVDLTALGTTDWVHWAFQTVDEVNRKVGGGAVIGDYGLVGGAKVVRKTTASGYVWSDGAPRSSSAFPRRKGLRNRVVGGGFTLNIPATTDPSTLRLFVGARAIDATITATLSDGSVTPVTLPVSAGGTPSSLQAEFVFAADSAGVTLDITYTLDAITGSGVTHFLEAVALEAGGSPGNQPPVLANIGDVTLVEGDSLSLALAATDPDDSSGLVFSQTNTLPLPAASLTDNGDGTGTIDWTSSIGDAAGSPYEIDVIVADPAGAEDSQTVTVTVLPDGSSGGGLLNASSTPAPTQVNLTVLGKDDWAHWGFGGGAPFVSMGDGSGDISDLSPIGSTVFSRFSNGLVNYSWTNGSPVVSATDTRTSMRVRNVGQGLSFEVAADPQDRTLVVYVSARRALGRLTAELSDGSAAPLTVDLFSQQTKKHFAVTLNFRADNPGSVLNLSYEFISQPSSGPAWITVESATLETTSTGFALPFTDDFASGAAQWQVVDEASGTTSDWIAQNNRYEQQNFMGFADGAMQNAQQVGTLSYLGDADTLADYRFSVDLQPLVGSTQGFSQDLGVLVRYDPVTGDQIRLSFSGANSFSRFEHRLGGVVRTLAQNSVGFNDTSVRNVEVAVQGAVITASVDGQKFFAGYDDGLLTGTVGLYCRNACAFDDVSITPIGSAPAVVLAAPVANSVQTDTTFAVSAVVLNVEPGATVEFDVPGETNPCTAAVQSAPGLFTATCTVSGTGVYSVEVAYLDAQSTQLDSDTRANVGVGDSYIGLGNSITAGLDDSTAGDAISANGLVLGTQGFEAALSDRLTNSTMPVVVSNNGVPGDTSSEISNKRIAGVLERHAGASSLLLTVGVNEAGGGMFLPSGLGCTGAACDGTFKGNVQSIVDDAIAANVTPIVSRTPPRFGDPFQAPYSAPATHPRNLLIRDEYNEVIDNELSGALLGPDLFRLFLGPENRFYLYATNLHPNALGYHLMAAEFEAAITGNPQTVFYANTFCVRKLTGANCQQPLLAKQNLLEVGSTPYIGDSRTLTGTIPAALDDGRWIQTEQSDRDLTNADYLSFEVPSTSTMYVAYDSAASSLPTWLSTGFTATGLTLTTSGATGSELALYQQNNVLGSVVLGAAAANANGANVNYVVILVEN